jgi:catechol 2,3-dioxygenase-like lactoylglutathione lyase family enzyme
MIEMKLELVPVPVTDVDRAIEFYTKKVGFKLDFDVRVNPKLRFVQLTPPGSACSLVMGEGITDDMKPGSQRGLQMVVKNAQEAHDELQKNGLDVSDIDKQDWGNFVRFADPDGNTWALQEIVKKN